MAIKLVVEPGRTVTWEEFGKYPRRSIAIDGYCSGAPRFSSRRVLLNINHHENVDRIATRSSCAQAMHLLKMGIYDAFRVDGRPCATLYVNDCDQDVVLATYTLMHPNHVDRPRLKMLTQLEDLLDMSAGLYPIKKRWHLLKMLTWINEPYTHARASGALYGMDAAEQRALIETMHRRVRETLYGRGKEAEPDIGFDVIEDFGDWKVVREKGLHARIGLGQAGVKAFVSYRPLADGRAHCIIARRSKFVRAFPLSIMFPKLNAAEQDASGEQRMWGGSLDTVIGSPLKDEEHKRPAGTILPLSRIIAIVKESCDERAEQDK